MRKADRQGRRFIGFGGKEPSPANPGSVSLGNTKFYDLPKCTCGHFQSAHSNAREDDYKCKICPDDQCPGWSI